MPNIDKDIFIENSTKVLNEIWEVLENLPDVILSDLPRKQSAFVIVDMINGFAKKGALYSPRVEALIPEITRLSKLCDDLSIKKIAFADNHIDLSPEFGNYPIHCITGTTESEVVDEIKAVGGYTLIPKNSTNGFLEEKFKQWLDINKGIDHFIIAGDCTDICILQFAITLKTWFNQQNRKSRIIVPINAVDTYDLGLHEANLMQIMALFNMIGNGIEVVGALA